MWKWYYLLLNPLGEYNEGEVLYFGAGAPQRREDANGTKEYGAEADWRRKHGVSTGGQEPQI